MEDAKRLLVLLKNNYIDVYLQNGKLKTNSRPGAITAEIAKRIKAHKEELIALLMQEQEFSRQPVEKIEKIHDKTDLPLSFGQSRIWFVEQLNKNTAEFNIPLILNVSGSFELSLAERAICRIIERHEILRTVYEGNNGRPVPKVNETFSFKFKCLDLTSLSPENQQQRLEELIAQDSSRPFDLTSDLMVRASYIQLTADGVDHKGILLFNMHHIAADGWSFSILINEFVNLYEAFLNHSDAHLPPLSIQYSDYAYWQRQSVSKQNFTLQLDYWRKQLVDIPMLHALPLDYPRPAIKQHEGRKVSGQLPQSISNELLTLSKSRQVTPFMLFHAVISLVLSRHSNRKDIVIGTPLANRKLPQVESLIGFFVNTLVLRTSTDFEFFDEYLNHVKQVNLDAQANQDVPFEQIVELSGAERSKNYLPLAEIQFSMNTAELGELALPDVTFSPMESEHVESKFDLNISADIRNDGIYFEWLYDQSVFCKEHIQQLNDHLLRLLTQLASEEAVSIADLNMFSERELNSLLCKFNDTQTPYDQDLLIHQVFERQVELQKGKPALIFEDQALSYEELNQASNQLAHYLIEQGVKADTLVGVYVERSLEMFIAILGILKAGGAYLPLDPGYPQSRLDQMVVDSGIEHVLTQKELMSDNLLEELTVLPLDQDIRELLLGGYPVHNPDSRLLGQKPSQLAYVIYTSGSTGTPKGVMVEHRGAVNMSQAQSLLFDLNPDSRVLHFASLGFDASCWEWMMGLLQGASLHVCNESQRLNPKELSQLILNQGISHATLPPALLQHLERRNDYRLKSLIVAGEACSRQLVESWAGIYPMYNAYGPTETTVCASVAPLAVHKAITIGYPIANTSLFILDDKQQVLPDGTIGELYVGGHGLARGYLNQDALTAERFISAEIQGERQRLYRTGDLVRRLADGNIEFMGRVDSQVKIRGFRVELAEIEHALNQHEHVEAAQVLLKDDDAGKQQLIAYVVAASGGGEETTYLKGLKAGLQSRLPAHMVPASIVLLTEFPLTANGKIDKASLPEPSVNLQAVYVAPETETEKVLTELWGKLLSLDVEEVGVTSNFFELGGHSLLAMMLVGDIRERLGVDIDISTLFEAPDIRQLAASVENARGTAKKPITAIERDGRVFPATFGQKRLWFTDRLGGDQAYNIPMYLQVNGYLDIDAVEQVIVRIIQRHEALRTVFAEHSQGPVQIIREDFDFGLQRFDLSGLAEEEKQNQLQAMINEESCKPFDLTADVMIRASYVHLGSQAAEPQGILLFNMHHIAADGWSLGILVDEFMELYQSLTAKADSTPAPLTIQYGDYAHWQAEYLDGEALSPQLGYWAEQLKGAPVIHALPLDFPRPAVKQHLGAMVNGSLSAPLSQSLQSLAREYQVTPFIVLHAALSLVLSLHSNQNDIVIGTPSANRAQPGLDKLIGFFVNTLVLRTSTDFERFDEYLAHVKQVNQDALANQDVPFEKLVELSHADRSTQYMPLAEIQFNMDNMELGELSIDGAQFSALKQDKLVARFDLNVSAAILDDGIHFTWVYDSSIFKEQRIQQLNEHLLRLLQGILASPKALLSDLPILSDAEVHQQLKDFNSSDAEGLANDQIQTLFEHIVKQNPDRPALVFEDNGMTYRELNEAANRVAHYLLEQGLEADALVGVYIERSAEMLIAILAILKAGAAYLPLDPAYPQSRLEYFVQDSNIELVLTQQSLMLDPVVESLSVIPLDPDVRNVLFGDYPTKDPALAYVNSSDLAYVIYTSGSTGQPKGVMIEHRGAVNMALAQHQLFNVTAHSNVLHFASLGFDAGVSEWMMALLKGACLHVCNDEERLNPQLLSRLLLSHQISHATIPPALLHHIEFRDDYSLDCVIVAGEPCQRHLADRWAEKYPLFNAYGPTEASVCASVARLKAGEIVNIGKPIANTQCYILDNNRQLLPVGVTGELYLGGAGLARGYINQAELSKECFVEHSFADAGQQRLYRTGDLVRYLPDGRIEFVGRTDEQVKIRGFRIELAEIAYVLNELPDIDFSHVIVWQTSANDKRLVAYIQPATGQADEAQFIGGVRLALKGRLPEYMIPSVFVLLHDVPVTANGKVDKNALPAPGDSALKGEYIAPKSETEKQLAGIWAGLLQLEKEEISADANFFELGGHSLLAVRLVSEIRDSFGLELAVNVIFDAHSLKALAGEIEQSHNTNLRLAVQPVDRKDLPIALSFAQQRLWFIDRLKNGTPEYNTPVAMSVKGHLDLDAVESAIERIIRRHQSLRTCYIEEVSGPVQVVRETFDFKLRRVDLTKLDSEQKSQQVERLIREDSAMPFDLSRDLMVRATYMMLEDLAGQQKGILLFNIHHIATDGWSMGVLVKELESQYKAAVAGELDPLPPLAIQYGDYAICQRQWREGDALELQLGYWRKQLEGAPAVHALQLQGERNDLDVNAGKEHISCLPESLSQSLLDIAKAYQMTPFMLLHAAIALVLSRHSSRQDIIIGTPVANRMQKELEPLIGFFVNTLALRTNTDFDTVKDYFDHVRQVNMDAQANQDVPFEYLVEHCQVVRSEQHTPLFQIMFKMTNFELEDIDLPGVNFTPIAHNEVFAKFDIEITAQLVDGKINLSWVYDKELFDPEYISLLDEHLHRLLAGIDTNEQARLSQLPMISENEVRRLIKDLNDTECPFPQDRQIHEFFQQQAAAQPEHCAVQYEGKQLNYRALNEAANQLAHYFREQGVGPETLVGLCLERSPEMVIAILAVLKAGGAYLPLDPEYPEERLAYMLSNSEVRYVLSHSGISDKLPLPEQVQLIGIDRHRAAIETQSKSDPKRLEHQGVDNLAYVIYTSGSTGEPKGVMVEHKALVNRIDWMQKRYHLSANDKVLQKTPYSFDVSVWEFVWTLGQGATLVMAKPEGHKDPVYLSDLIAETEISVLHFVPSMLSTYLRTEQANFAASVRAVFCSGEALEKSLALTAMEQAPHIALHNLYGPTEAAIDVSAFDCREAGRYARIPIGKPIQNIRFYVLDPQLNICPMGVAGELYIAGTGLARGYLNQESLTQSRFIDSPLGDGERWYRSGDLVCYLPDGNLDYIGRVDDQVKIRGLRIELGEIQNQLLRNEKIAEAVVLVQEAVDGDKTLAAYLKPNQALLDSDNGIVDAERSQEWQEVWEDTYAEIAEPANSAELPANPDLTDKETNIIGWNCSFRGHEIPLTEMQEWLEDTVETIRSLKPKRILEIGVGTGMLLYRYGEECQHVCGLDISKRAIATLRRGVADKGWSHVSLEQGSSLELSVFKGLKFDTIILNSVAQYFPSARYFSAALEEMSNYLTEDGKILLGDLRNLDLNDAFSTSVALFKAQSDASAEAVRQSAAINLYHEEELLLSPSHFAQLVNRKRDFARFDVMVKQGRATNEMMRYRYDVVLYKTDTGSSVNVHWQPWQGLNALRELLANTEKCDDTALGVYGFINGRIHQDLLAMRELNSSREASIARLKSMISLQSNQDLVQVKQLAHAMGFQLSATGSQELPEQLDLIFIHLDATEFPPIHARSEYSKNYQVNNPQLKSISRRLLPQIKAELEKRLPAFMLPNAYMLLESFPLSKNGKVDKKALPAIANATLGDYRAPETVTEEKLLVLWKDLLRQPKLGVDDNFFALGGHSLLGIRLINEIRQEIGVEIGVKALFDNPTIAGLAAYIEHNATRGKLSAVLPAISPVGRLTRTEFPLSFAQQRLWFIDKLKQGSPEYNMPVVQMLSGKLDLKIAQAAMSKIIERHEILRTVYGENGTGSVQRVLEQFNFEIAFHDLSHLHAEEQETVLENLLSHDIYRTFDLGKDLMVRASYFHLSGEHESQTGVLLFNIHHIAGDGWSLSLMIREFSSLYQSLAAGAADSLQALDIQYRDYAIWQRQWLTDKVLQEQLTYWQQQLEDVPAVHSLKTDYPRPTIKQSCAGLVQALLDKSLSEKLQQLAVAYEVTPFMLLHGALALVLSRHSGTSDIVIGTPVANRQQLQLESLIGLFVNNLVLRVNTDYRDLNQYLTHVKAVNLDALANQDLPFEQLVEHCRVARSMQHTPLFQIMFSMVNHEVSSLTLPGLTLSPYSAGKPIVKFDLDISAMVSDDGIVLNWIYDTSLFKRSSIEALNRHLSELLNQLVANPELPLSRQPIMTDREVQSLITMGEGTNRSFAADLQLHELFEYQARRTPDAVALVFEGKPMKYNALNQAANQLAGYLRQQGVVRETLVGICLNRSFDMVVAMLAVLKAGGAYMPLDPSYPSSRLEYMLADANVRFMVTEQAFGDDFARLAQMRVIVPKQKQHLELIQTHPVTDLVGLPGAKPSSAAYVIYTSGSTGKPKGVVVEQSALLNFVMAMQEQLGSVLNENTRVLALTTFAFDIASLELLAPLVYGGRSVIAQSQDVVNPTRIASLVNDNDINFIQATPATWQLLVNADWAGKTDLTVLCGGEELQANLAKALLERAKTVWNCYGPTEATVWSLVKEVTPDNIYQEKVLLGGSLANYQHLVLDANQELVPLGAVGELCISGQGLARGYLNRPALNADKFIEKSFPTGQRLRLYRTGDLVRSLGNGDFEFCGRIDHQVKIRGYRIELGEIENLLATDDNLSTALVIARDDGLEQKRLLAYVVPKPEAERYGLEAKLKQSLALNLPHYMLPTTIYILEEIPLSSNGKVDRSKLPYELRPPAEEEYVAPQSETEKVIVRLWSEILSIDVDAISRHANFFELGGHSLLLVRFVTLVEDTLHISLPLEKLFNNSKVSEMADLADYLINHNKLTKEMEEQEAEIERIEF